MKGFRNLLLKAAAALLMAATGGCSWFPLADYPSPPSPTFDEPAQTLDLNCRAAVGPRAYHD